MWAELSGRLDAWLRRGEGEEGSLCSLPAGSVRCDEGPGFLREDWVVVLGASPPLLGCGAGSGGVRVCLAIVSRELVEVDFFGRGMGSVCSIRGPFFCRAFHWGLARLARRLVRL